MKMLQLFALAFLSLISSADPRSVGGVHSYGLAGDLLVSMMVIQLPKAQVQSWLPDGLELAKQSLTDPGTHPVGLLFDEQSNVREISSTGQTLPSPIASYYLEFAITIPYVQISGSATGTGKPAGPFLHILKLDLNDWGAIAVGRHHYGLNKFFANVSTDRATYQVTDAANAQSLVSAKFTPVRIYDQIAFFGNLTSLAGSFALPFVGIKNGAWVCSNNVFSTASADFSPLQLQVDLGSALSQMFGTTSLQTPGLDQQVMGGMRMESTWTLSPPYPCF